MGLDLEGVLAEYGQILAENNDVSIAPDIPGRKLRRAIRAYGQSIATHENVQLLIDNTVLRSGKEGMMLTHDHLLCKTGPSGVLAIPFSEIESASPDLTSVGPVPIPGLKINDEHFIALPGMARALDTLEHPAMFLLVVVLQMALGIGPVGEKEDIVEVSDFIKSDFDKSDFNKED
jgi:hypothetical protein